MRNSLLNINKNISFQEDTHEYRDKHGNKLLSVTTLLSIFKEKFDEYGHIARACARRDGVTEKEIHEKWDKEKNRACLYGRNIHAKIESFIKNGKIQEDEDEDIIKDFSNIDFSGQILSEIGLHSKKYGLAGTCDIAVVEGDTVTIHDIKTNKVFLTKSKYNKKFLFPIQNVPDSHLHAYSLQILIYGEMVKEHGYKFNPGHILWVNPESRKIEKFQVLDMSKEVKKLLDHYRILQEW